MKLHANHVLIKLTKKTDELNLPEIGTVEIETIFDSERHQRIVGIVTEVPDELIFENLNHAQMPWETKMKARIGDEVIVRRTDISSSRGHGMSFEIDGHLHVYVPYSSLILVKRKLPNGMKILDEMGMSPLIGSDGFADCDIVKPTMSQETYGAAKAFAASFHPSTEDELGESPKKIEWSIKKPSQIVEIEGEKFEVIMLNGYMLVEQDDEDFGTHLSLPENMKEAKAQTGTIRFIGESNTRYHDQQDSQGRNIAGNLPDEQFDLKVGDRIGFLKFSAIDLEFDLHQTFAGKGVHFGRLQRNKVLCKL